MMQVKTKMTKSLKSQIKDAEVFHNPTSPKTSKKRGATGPTGKVISSKQKGILWILREQTQIQPKTLLIKPKIQALL